MNIKLVHILTEPDTRREMSSIDSLSPLGELGLEYIQQINQRYVGDAWKSTPALSQSPATNHGPGHYGAFQSFKKAMLDNFTEDLDALVLCECDCVLECSPDEFMSTLRRGIDFCKDNNLKYLSLGSRFVNGVLQSPETGSDANFPDFYVTNKVILAHCIVLPASSRDLILGAIDKFSWDSPDIWFNEALWRSGVNRFGIVKERLARQHEGISLIDNVWKESQ
jgi:hypothetical protein